MFSKCSNAFIHGLLLLHDFMGVKSHEMALTGVNFAKNARLNALLGFHQSTLNTWER